MQYAIQLGQKIDQQWRKAHCNLDKFPAIAQQALTEFPPEQHIAPTDIVDFVLGTDWFPRQVDLTQNFGQPPVTLFSNDVFDIDAYFWTDGSTAIHEHSFCGAFYVLEGSSVHSEYTFQPDRVYNHRLITGELAIKSVEVLQQGDCRPILAGHEYIHSLFHLDRPSVTIVVRTGVPGSLPQLSYEFPCLAHANRSHESPRERRKRQMLAMLRKIDHPRYVDKLKETLLECEPYEMYTLLNDNRTYFQDKLPELRGLLTSLKGHFGELISQLVEVFRHDWRIRAIHHLRPYLKTPEHRFFLALLLNANRRCDFLELTAQRFPGTNPVDLILKWVNEIAETKINAEQSVNALGVELNDMSLAVLRGALHGQAPSELYLAEHTTRINGNRGDWEQEYARMKSQQLLQPLFTA